MTKNTAAAISAHVPAIALTPKAEPGPWEVRTTCSMFEAEVLAAPQPGTSARAVIYQGDIDTARLVAAAPQLADTLARIFNADTSGNNGAFMGEAVLCREFAARARDVLTAAGLIRP